jgi:hypothetical protein
MVQFFFKKLPKNNDKLFDLIFEWFMNIYDKHGLLDFEISLMLNHYLACIRESDFFGDISEK